MSIQLSEWYWKEEKRCRRNWQIGMITEYSQVREVLVFVDAVVESAE